MDALVTNEQAKRHLRVTTSDFDDEIELKSEQATAIVLEYLKSRANKRAVIVSSSVANPTVITTEEAHDFANGNTAVIADHEDSAPAISGSYVVSSVTEKTFTIPATVAWDVNTVPQPVQTAILLVLEDLFEHRPIDWDVQRRLLERSRDPALA
jgi:uncharacterized secreted protein with C-terminal beta-propeller domain